MVLAVGERGFAHVRVGAVCAQAKVSRGTFAELFDGPEDCFLAVLDDGYRGTRTLISQAFEREGSWLDGVRGALVALLLFFDADPVLARVLLVEAAAAGAWARERRERRIASLMSLIERRWGAPPGGDAHPHVTAGVMASILGVLHTHLVTGRREPLITLLGSLMGLITAPYLEQRQIVREIERADAAVRDLLAGRRHEPPSPVAEDVAIPALLRNSRAHRARACLLHLAEHPGASNRQIASAVGIVRHNHISALLARLAGMELLLKRPPHQRGGPNAWSLTPHGERVLHALMNAHMSDAQMTASRCAAHYPSE